MAGRLWLALALVALACAGPLLVRAEPALPVSVTRLVDAQLVDLGTPAFVDGLAGLLVVHARRDPQRAGAIGRRVLARAPGADGQVARALTLAGFDPAVAGLASVAPAATEDAVSSTLRATARDAIPAWSGAAVTGSAYSSPSGSSSASGNGGGGAVGSPTLIISAGQTARPGTADLATPQLR